MPVLGTSAFLPYIARIASMTPKRPGMLRDPKRRKLVMQMTRKYRAPCCLMTRTRMSPTAGARNEARFA